MSSATGRQGRLAGKVVLVTGAGNGIGNAVARVAAEEGALVASLDYDGDAASATASAIGGADVMAIRADLSKLEEVETAVAQVVSRFGRIDVLANVAGVVDLFAPTEEITATTWDTVFSINVRGTAFMIQSALKYMLPAKAGAIVNMASTAAYKAGGGGVAYTASKGAIVSLTRQVAYEVADRGIRVNAIAPGATATNLLATSAKRLGAVGKKAQHFLDRAVTDFLGSIPLARFAEPVEIARATIFLASDEASYITGAVLVVDGGFTIV